MFAHPSALPSANTSPHTLSQLGVPHPGLLCHSRTQRPAGDVCDGATHTSLLQEMCVGSTHTSPLSQSVTHHFWSRPVTLSMRIEMYIPTSLWSRWIHICYGQIHIDNDMHAYAGIPYACRSSPTSQTRDLSPSPYITRQQASIAHRL